MTKRKTQVRSNMLRYVKPKAGEKVSNNRRFAAGAWSLRRSKQQRLNDNKKRAHESTHSETRKMYIDFVARDGKSLGDGTSYVKQTLGYAKGQGRKWGKRLKKIKAYFRNGKKVRAHSKRV